MFHTKIVLLLLSLIVPLLVSARQSERIEALITINDCTKAVVEAQEFLDKDSDRQDVWELYIRALAQQNSEERMLHAWELYKIRFPHAVKKTHLMEIVAWGIIENALTSSQPIVRLYALLAAAFVNQSRSVPIIIKLLRDPQAEVRATAAHFAAHFHDLSIQEEIPLALSRERHPAVREELIRALSVVERQKSERILKQIIASPTVFAEEKAVAVRVLLERKDLDADEIESLIKSDRAELRRLACLLVAQTLADAQRPLLTPLLQDPFPAVRAAAVYSVGLLPDTNLEAHLQDIDPQVSILASRALLLQGKELGRCWMEHWLQSGRSDLRRQASAALAATGRAGVDLMEKIICSHPDPFVRANIAVGLIGQRQGLEAATKALYAFLEQPDLSLCWKESEIFPYLTDIKKSVITFGSSSLEIKNHQTKLQLLKMLSTVDPVSTEVHLRKLINHHAWQISASAASLLLMDSNPERLIAVEQLLKDPDPQIRIESALICALFGYEEKSLFILEEAYVQSDREMKERILEAMGQIGSEQSIPFLLDVWKESPQILRLIAAAGILNTL